MVQVVDQVAQDLSKDVSKYREDSLIDSGQDTQA